LVNLLLRSFVPTREKELLFPLTSFPTKPILFVMERKTWPLRDLTLKVLDLPAQVAFYEAFGFHLAEKKKHQAVLTAGEGACVTLNQLANGRPRPPKTAGLFHFAGAADHLVSESLYFSDEEGNGIEVILVEDSAPLVHFPVGRYSRCPGTKGAL
jgi:catechol 2,3-dioxygenase-like lactoylglutathione lyase family enzyme